MAFPAPASLDPGTATDPTSLDLLSALFEPLVRLSDYGDVHAASAEEWEVHADGTRYRFRLRDGLHWSDGEPLTAHDYVWAWQRNLTLTTAAPYAGLLYPIQNAREVHTGQLDPAALEVRAPDDRTLEVTLVQPNAEFLAAASAWVAMPIPRHTVEQQGREWPDPADFVGNGPYRLAGWSEDDEIVLEANRHYMGPHPAQVERIVLSIFPEESQEDVLQAYEADRLDATGSHFILSASAPDRIRANPDLASELVTFDLASGVFVVVNHRQPHLQDERVRLALGMALDRTALVAETLEQAASPTASLAPLGIDGRGAALSPPEDVAEARRLLSEAGYPESEGLPPLRFTYSRSEANQRLAGHLERHWRETLGVTLELQALDWPDFVAWLRDGTWEQQGDLHRMAWMSELADPGHEYRTLWSTEAGDPFLRTGWRNEEFETLLRQASTELEHQSRLALYDQAAQLLARDYPAIPLYQYRGHALVKSHVRGFQPRPVLGLTPWTELHIED